MNKQIKRKYISESYCKIDGLDTAKLTMTFEDCNLEFTNTFTYPKDFEEKYKSKMYAFSMAEIKCTIDYLDFLIFNKSKQIDANSKNVKKEIQMIQNQIRSLKNKISTALEQRKKDFETVSAILKKDKKNKIKKEYCNGRLYERY